MGTEVLLMSTHNICFCGEIRNLFISTSLLSRAMCIQTVKKNFLDQPAYPHTCSLVMTVLAAFILNIGTPLLLTKI